MYLTRREERILDGSEGYARQVAMKILVALGDLFGADRLIPIQWAHVAGVSYKNLGDASVEFLERLAGEGVKAQAFSTLNPCALDLERWGHMPLSRERYESQLRIIHLYSRMGIKPTLTCTPYYLAPVRRGAHLAWAESSAISYANSVLGARTNREGGPSALASALIGRTPRYGYHLDENRRGDLLVKVQTPLKSVADYGALGFLVGERARMSVPVFQGIRACSRDCLKALGASMAASGAVALYHIAGVTPECPSEDVEAGLWRDGKPRDTISIGEEELQEAYLRLTTSSGGLPDLAFVGCPHCSIQELRWIARRLEGRRIKGGMRFWVCTSRWVKNLANKEGLISRLEASGVEVYCDTCVVVTWLKDVGVDSIITNSAKAAYYVPQLCGVEVEYAGLTEIISRATAPR